MNTHSAIGSPSDKEMHILDVTFNQDQGCFSVAHEKGFLVYNTNPIDLRVKRMFHSSNLPGSGIGHIAMLHRTNYLALVGGGKNPKFPNNKVIIWDDLKRKTSLSLSFMSPVLNVLLSRIRIVVVLLNQVVVFEFSAPPRKFASYETSSNEYGLADLSVHAASLHGMPGSLHSSDSGFDPVYKDHPKYQILAFPGRTVGQIQLVDVSSEGQGKNSVSIIKAHKSKIRCITLNRTGTLIASASETGTLIRIHSTSTTALLFEFRRGLDRAMITSMKFSPNDTKLAVLSDKNTLHVFNIASRSDNTVVDPFGDGETVRETPLNRQHFFKRLPLPIPVPNYFNSTWSFCSLNTSKYHTDMDGSLEHINDIGILGWAGDDSIIIIWKEKKIWEKFVITENSSSGSKHQHKFELVRTGWKNLENLVD